MQALIFLLLFLPVVSPNAFAQNDFRQWEPLNGAALRQADHIEFYRSVVSRATGVNSGEVALAWSDTRRGDRNIYVQLLGADGEVKFALNGSHANRAESVQQDPVIAPCSDGGWFVAWVDFSIDSLGDIACTKIDSDGEILWGDATQGISPYAEPLFASVQQNIKLLPDEENGCFVIWSDFRGGAVSDIYAAHIEADGRRDDVWPEMGLPVAVAHGAQTRLAVIPDSEGGFILAWNDGRVAGDHQVRAQRITVSGDALWGSSILVCDGSATGGRLAICSDGLGGAFIFWSDLRNADRSGDDVWGQHLDMDGNNFWTDGGEAVCSEPGDQSDVAAVSAEDGEAIVVWCDQRGDRQTEDIYAMKVGGDDELVKWWDPPSGLPVAVAERAQNSPFITPDGSGGIYIAWDDERNHGFPEVDIYLQHISRDGEVVWQENGIRAHNNGSWLSSRGIVRTDTGCMVIWSDFHRGESALSGQRYDSDGNPEWDRGGRELVTGYGGNSYLSSSFSNHDGSVTVCWTDGRMSGMGPVPYLQVIVADQELPAPRFEEGGIPVIEQLPGGGVMAMACPDGERGAFVAWEDHRAGQPYSIYVQLVNSQGDRLFGETGIRVADDDEDQEKPEICPSDDGGIFVTWRGFRRQSDDDVMIQKMDADGVRLWGGRGIEVATSDEDESNAQIAPDGEGGVIVCWQRTGMDPETFDLVRQIYIDRFDEDGVRRWGDEYGISIAVSSQVRLNFVLKCHQDGWIVVWEDGREGHVEDPPDVELYGQFIDFNGDLLWGNGGTLICESPGYQRDPAVEIDRRGDIWVAWSDARDFEFINGEDIYIQKFSPEPDQNGNLRFQFPSPGPDARGGMRLCGEPGHQSDPRLIHDGANGMWAIWEDRRGGIWTDLYGVHLDRAGRLFEGWTEGGMIISDAFHHQSQPAAVLIENDGREGLFVSWEDGRASGKEELLNLYMQRIDDDAASVGGSRDAETPDRFEISSIHPNPFNSKALISYTLPQSGRCALSVIDATGREVIRKGFDWMPAGRYQTEIDGSSIPSGFYTLMLKLDDERFESSLILVR